MPDRLFSDPRLASLYDALQDDRDDLDQYQAMADEFTVDSVLDVGCGTGTLALRLAAQGMAVTGVDPARASLDIARAKPGADRVRWLLGDATTVPDDVSVELAVMTGNVAQVFVGDDEWTATVDAINRRLVCGGRFVFETRDPAVRAWERWVPGQSRRSLSVPGVGSVETWFELLEVESPTVTFRAWYRFDDEVLHSDSTLRFRERDELEAGLVGAGFVVDEVREAPDRPGLEFVFVARRPR